MPAQARGLSAQHFIRVSVCSFTFRFVDRDEISEYILFFKKKTHPSSRLPMPEGADSFLRWHSTAPVRAVANVFYRRKFL
jgi:hypothetical protein